MVVEKDRLLNTYMDQDQDPLQKVLYQKHCSIPPWQSRYVLIGY